MSTIVAVRKNGIVVIAADTMTKYGTVYQRADFLKNNSKIIKYEDSIIAYVGPSVFGSIFPNYLSKLKNKPNLTNRDDIFEFVRKMHLKLKEDYYLIPHEHEDEEYESTQMNLLIANSSGIFGVYSYREVDEFNKYYAFGSGCRFALGAMHTVFKSIDDPEKIALAGLEAASEFDDGTGAPFEIYKLQLKE